MSKQGRESSQGLFRASIAQKNKQTGKEGSCQRGESRIMYNSVGPSIWFRFINKDRKITCLNTYPIFYTSD